MQLNEVIEENSLATISKRTRISVENIERLVHCDFSSMKRVKALGFISILEREFHLELDTLKKECIEYFSPYPDEEFDAKLVVTVPESREYLAGSRYFSKILMLIVLFAIGYGAWYFYTHNKNGFSENNATASTGTSFIGSIVDQAKVWLGNSNSLEHNTTNDAPNASNGVWAKQDTDETTEDAIEQPTDAQQGDESRSTDEKNDTALEEQIIREVKEQQQELLTKKREENPTDMLTIEGLLNEETTAADDAPAIEPTEGTLAVEVPSMVNETNADEIVAIEETKPEVEAKPKEQKKTDKKVNQKKVVTLHPTKKVWVGYTNLKSMKRAAKVIEADIDFDTTSESWILVAGHNAFNFVIRGKTITPKKRSKNYFLIKNGKIKAIDQKKFQKLNKSTVW